MAQITDTRGNDTLKGGKGSDVFVYTAGKDTITNYKEDYTIKISAGTVSKISTTKAGNVVFTVGTGKITVKDAADKIVTYEDADGVKNFYPIDFNSKGTSATLLSAYGKDEFDLDDFDGLKNLDASKVTRALEIEGNKLANKIIGGEEDDTIEGGKGNDTLTGGDGKDVFIYRNGDGNDIITDYTSGDKIQIVGGTSKNISVSVARNGDVLVSYGGGSITLQNAGSLADKIKFVDEKGNSINPFPGSIPGSVLFNAAGTAATLAANYLDDKFDAADYADTLATIDASAVNYDFEIIGNKRINKIIDGSGNDIIRGEAGNDTLLGGDGNDVITDYEGGIDQIIVLGNVSETKVEAPIVDTEGNVTFPVGSGQIVVKGGANRYIKILDGSGNHVRPYIPPRA